jgi:hypothetical protein
MIHTVELRTKSSEKAAFNRLRNTALCYQFPGITFTPYREGKDELAQYKVTAKINLIQTIEPRNYLGIYTGRHTERILDAINQAFGEVGLPPVDQWGISQIHFTVDVRTPYVAEYMKILAKGNHKHEPTHTENGLYIPYSERGITVNFYDKAEQQRAKYGDEAAEQARDILRLEIECKYDKLTTLFSKCPVARDLRSFLLVDGGSHILDMVRDTVEKELLQIVTNNCDHISQRAALARVRDSKKQANIKKQLAEILREINAEGSSISIAKNSLCGGVEAAEKKFRRRIRDLYSLGINPICVPPGLAVKRLESLEQLYLDALIAECNSEE